MFLQPSRAGLLALGAVMLVGCQVITEELPTRASTAGAPAAPIPTVVVVPVPTPPPATPAPAPTPGPSPGATPAPAPSPGATPPPGSPDTPSPVYAVRVAFFGIDCGRGVPVPRNGQGLLPRGCRGFVTATPKNADNTDVPPRIHGPDVDWFVLYGEDRVDVLPPTFESNFNKDVVGVRVGNFGLCATVKGTTGCLLGDVIPR